MSQREPTLYEALEYKGLWWLPQFPDDKIAGDLSFSPGGMFLQLEGNFNSSRVLEVGHDEAVILGHTFPDAREVTLIQCLQTSRSQNFPGYSTVEYTPQTALLGNHYNSVADIQFRSMFVSYSNLEEWICVPPFQLEPSDIHGNRGFSASYTDQSVVLADLTPTEGKISCEFMFAETGDKRFRSLTWERNAYIRFETLKPQSLSWFREQARVFRNLLTVLVGAPIQIRVLRTPNSVPTTTVRTVGNSETFVLYVPASSGNQESVGPEFMNVSAENIRSRTPQVIGNWFRRQTKLRKLTELFLGVEYGTQESGDFTLLALTQALEGYHRDQNQVGDPRLRVRLTKLLDLVPKPIRLKVVPDPNDFIDAVVSTRDLYSHRYEPNGRNILEAEPLFWANIRLKIWITVLIYRELQIPIKVIRDALMRNRMFRHVMDDNPDARGANNSKI